MAALLRGLRKLSRWSEGASKSRRSATVQVRGAGVVDVIGRVVSSMLGAALLGGLRELSRCLGDASNSRRSASLRILGYNRSEMAIRFIVVQWEYVGMSWVLIVMGEYPRIIPEHFDWHALLVQTRKNSYG
jgi:hypothetical protein